MGEILMIGPYKIRDLGVSVIDEEMGFSENRDITDIEGSVSNLGFPFRFLNHLQELSLRFRDTDALEILDSGCGSGRALKRIKDLTRFVGKHINTTGIEQTLGHPLPWEGEELEGIDRLIVGSLQHAHLRRVLSGGGFHFILDYFGPLHYDYRLAGGRYAHCGETTVPIYGEILAVGGTALLATDDLRSQPTRMTELFADYGLATLMCRNAYALVEKVA